MDKNELKYFNEIIKNIIETYGFNIKTQISECQTIIIQFNSQNFFLEIEKYYRELYSTIYFKNEPDRGVNLFNLLEYLKQEDTIAPKSEYFHKEKDLEESYRKQLNYVSKVIFDNLTILNNFFHDQHFKVNMLNFEKYWKNKYPEFYKSKRCFHKN